MHKIDVSLLEFLLNPLLNFNVFIFFRRDQDEDDDDDVEE